MESNFSSILSKNADLYPEKIYLQKINGGSLTFRELDDYVNRCCDYLYDLGVRENEIVTTNIPNCLSSIIIYLASIRSGIIINPSPSSLSSNELLKHIKFLETKLLICKKDLDENLLDKNCLIENFSDDESFFEKLDLFSKKNCHKDISPNTAACVYYSSGTTGNSKYVLYSHLNMVSLARSIVNDFGFSFNTNHLGILPLGHTAITNYQFLPSLYVGSTLFLAENFNIIRPKLWKIIKLYKIDNLQIVPTVLFSILATPYKESEYKSNISLKYIGCGSAPLSTESQNQFYKKFNIRVSNLYGLSESGPSHFDNPLKKDWKPGSIGMPLSVNDCKIFSKDNKELDVNEIGQIGLKGDNIFIGYFKNEKAYKESFYNDYFLTGDLGYKDLEGKFYFADRQKDLIIKGGVNIVPAEIEEIIFKLSEVQSAAVVGVDHKYYGEEIIAFIQKKDPSLTKAKVHALLTENLQPLKIPSKIIFLSQMPVGPSGKILKRELRKQLGTNKNA